MVDGEGKGAGRQEAGAPAAPCRKGPVVNNWSNNELLLEPGAPDVHHS